MVNIQKNNKTRLSKKQIVKKKGKISKGQKIIMKGGEYSINIENYHTKEKITLNDIDPYYTIDYIKELISFSTMSIPAEFQRLIFNKQMLDDKRIVMDYNIKNGSTIFLVIRKPFNPNEQLELDLARRDAVAMANSVGLDSSNSSDSEEKLSHNMQGGMLLNVNYIAMNKLLTYDVDSSDTIEAIKGLIESREGVPPSQQRLIFNSRMLIDGRTLADYNVQKDSTIQLVLLRKIPLDEHDVPQTLLDKSRNLNNNIRNMSGGLIINWLAKKQIISIQLENNQISDIKRIIEDKTGIEQDIQRLIFNGKQLNDFHFLSDYEIKDNDTIYLVIRKLNPEDDIIETPKTQNEKMFITFNNKENDEI
jgi:hypothetical protein